MIAGGDRGCNAHSNQRGDAGRQAAAALHPTIAKMLAGHVDHSAWLKNVDSKEVGIEGRLNAPQDIPSG